MGALTSRGDLLVDLPVGIDLEHREAPTQRSTPSGMGPAGRRGPAPLDPITASEDADLTDVLVDGLRGQGLELVGEVTLAPQPEGLKRGGEPVRLKAAVAADEEALILVEEDGVFRWISPTSRETSPLPGATRRGGGGALRDQAAVFEIPTLPPVAGVRRGFVEQFVISRVRAFVFRFVARAGVGVAVGVLERNIDAGLFVINGLDMAKWTPSARVGRSPRALREGPWKVLLLVHGTFSSVAGTFGQLIPTPWGKAFLQGCLQHYDLVLGFNHRSLGDDPRQNAQALLDALKREYFGDHPPEIDVITHSRGGLVVRTLIEELAPASGLRASFARAILVATTNNGTYLASPENWRDLANLYTTLAVAGSRALMVLPGGAPAGAILKEAVSSLGEFVRQFTQAGLDPKLAPGLAAMRPDEAFVNALNQAQPSQFPADKSIYRVITSSFAPKLLATQGAPGELPKRLVELLADGFMDQLIGEPHDLVVHTDSMSAIDRGAGDFVVDRVDFPDSTFIYHTNYFARPEVVNALTRWLEIPEPRPGRRGLGAPIDPPTGGEPIPASVDTDVLVIQADDSAASAALEIQRAEPSYVVVRRALGDELFHYAYRPEEAVDLLRTRGGDVAVALDLHEHTSDGTMQLGRAQILHPATGLRFPTAEVSANRPPRTVILGDGDIPLGVVPNALEVITPADLASVLKDISEPGAGPQLKRAMPSFAPRMTVPEDVLELKPVRSAPRAGAGSPASATVAPPPPPTHGDCHFLAEAAAKVAVGTRTTIQITIAREVLEASPDQVSATDRAPVALDREIILEVICKRGFVNADGEEPERFMPPAPGQPLRLFFEVEATEVGEGELWVVARQGRSPLVLLKLKPQVLAGVGPARRTSRIKAEMSVAENTTTPPRHCLRINELVRNGETIFSYELDSPVLGMKRFRSEPIADRETFVDSLYRDIETRWTGSGESAADFVADLEEMGADLWRRLFPEALQAVLWKHRDDIDSIFVVSEEPFIPWELLFMVEPGKAMSGDGRFLAELGLIRWLWEANRQPPPALSVGKGRARYILPVYPRVQSIGLQPLPQAQEERTFLETNFQAEAVTPTLAEVRQLLRGPGVFDLLHFAGHGLAFDATMRDASIMLEGEMLGGSYNPSYLKSTAVAGNGDFGPRRPIAVLNACQAGRPFRNLSGLGGYAQAFLSRGAGVFVGTMWSVGDRLARDFTEALYQSLLDGASLAVAVKDARRVARQAEDATWLAYAVYGHPDATLELDPALSRP